MGARRVGVRVGGRGGGSETHLVHLGLRIQKRGLRAPGAAGSA